MAIYIKNKPLHRRVMKSSNRYADLAIKAYSAGKRTLGAKYERKSDAIYAKNYSKMFKIVR